MRRHLTVIVTILTLLFGGAALAQPSADPARLAAARDLFRSMGSEAQMRVAIETMTSGLANLVKQQKPGLEREIDDVFKALRDKFMSRTGEVTDMVAPLWAERFTVDEMKEIARFFESGIGKKLVLVQPELMQKAMHLGMQWGQRIGQEVEEEARRELKKRGIDL